MDDGGAAGPDEPDDLRSKRRQGLAPAVGTGSGMETDGMVAALRASDPRYLAVGFLAGAGTAVAGIRLENPVVLLLAPSLVAAFVLAVVNPNRGRLSREALVCSSLLPSLIVLTEAVYQVAFTTSATLVGSLFDLVVAPAGLAVLFGLPAMLVGGAINAVTARAVAAVVGSDEAKLPSEGGAHEERGGRRVRDRASERDHDRTRERGSSRTHERDGDRTRDR